MAIIRWDPFRDIATLHQEMNRLFDTLTPLQPHGFEGVAFMPAVEMHETPETIELKLELPGIDAKDLDVQVTENSVSIQGERKSETQTEEGGIMRSEFRYGRFQRIVPLPNRVKQTDTKAEYDQGILRLTLPKVETETSKVYKVELG